MVLETTAVWKRPELYRFGSFERMTQGEKFLVGWPDDMFVVFPLPIGRVDLFDPAQTPAAGDPPWDPGLVVS
jgi:hypothetical protein